jgi:hypothetical protein
VREILPAKLRARILGVHLHHGNDKVKVRVTAKMR